MVKNETFGFSNKWSHFNPSQQRWLRRSWWNTRLSRVRLHPVIRSRSSSSDMSILGPSLSLSPIILCTDRPEIRTLSLIRNRTGHTTLLLQVIQIIWSDFLQTDSRNNGVFKKIFGVYSLLDWRQHLDKCKLSSDESWGLATNPTWYNTSVQAIGSKNVTNIFLKRPKFIN